MENDETDGYIGKVNLNSKYIITKGYSKWTDEKNKQKSIG